MNKNYAAIFLVLHCLVSCVAAADCECYGEAGECLNTDEWSTFCNLSTMNYAIAGGMVALGAVALALDMTFYKSVEF